MKKERDRPALFKIKFANDHFTTILAALYVLDL